MFKREKGKLIPKILLTYLGNHILLILGILVIAGTGISLIEHRFFEKYKNNVEESVEALDEEIYQMKTILSHAMQDENVLMLRERKGYLSLYEEINYTLRIKDNLSVLSNQYRLIQDIGIYIPERFLWIEAQDWFVKKPAPLVSFSGARLDLREGTLCLIIGMKSKEPYTEGYIEFNQRELEKMLGVKIDEESVTQIFLKGELVGEPNGETAFSEKEYREIGVKSELYPLEVRLYIRKSMLSFRTYLYVLGAVSMGFLLVTTLAFSDYLNKAIHQPLNNMVQYIEGLEQGNFQEELSHDGVDEFKYVTMEFNRMKQNMEDYIKKYYQQEIALKQMELDHLQEQIKPHFLYNCFFNISNLCKTYDVEKVERLSLALARYYRYITRTGQSMVTLQEEYDHMRNYLAVQKIRFADRVDIQIDPLPEEGKQLLVPRLILQPIVENAYKYVFEHVESHGKLAVSTEENESTIMIRIEDSGNGTTDEVICRIREALKQTGSQITGLGNLQKRLQFAHHENGIEIDRSGLGGICNQVNLNKKGDINVQDTVN